MKERINEIRKDIEENLNAGYSIDELNEKDRADVEGFIWGIANTESAFDNYCADEDGYEDDGE